MGNALAREYLDEAEIYAGADLALFEKNRPATSSTFPRLFYLFAMALAAGLALSPAAIQDPDLWWHLRTGEWIAETGSIPQFDPFSTEGSRPWVAYTWAFDLIVFGVHRAGGETAICLSQLRSAHQWPRGLCRWGNGTAIHPRL